MAAAGRAGDAAVDLRPGVARLSWSGSPGEFEFFQAVRPAGAASAGRQSGGRFRSAPQRRGAAFRAACSFRSTFPGQRHSVAGAGATVAAAVDGVNFMGLTGPDGVLPLYYTVRGGTRPGRRHGVRDFLDIFNHRIISLFYQAWEKYRFTVPARAWGAGPVCRSYCSTWSGWAPSGCAIARRWRTFGCCTIPACWDSGRAPRSLAPVGRGLLRSSGRNCAVRGRVVQAGRPSTQCRLMDAASPSPSNWGGSRSGRRDLGRAVGGAHPAWAAPARSVSGFFAHWHRLRAAYAPSRGSFAGNEFDFEAH